MKYCRFFSLLAIVLSSSCISFTTPSPTTTSTSTPLPSVTPSLTFTPEPTVIFTPDLKSDLSHYGLMAYSAGVDSNEDIFIIHADGRNQTNITNNPARDIDPAWSPDGTRLAFVSTRIDGKPHIFSMNPDGSDVVQLTGGNDSGFFFEWSPDGKKIAYVTYSDDPNIYTAELIVMNTDGRNKIVLTDKLFSHYEVLGWSPDSQYLVYTIPEGYEGAGFYIVSADGANKIEWSDLSYMDRIHWLDNKNFLAYSQYAWHGQSKERWLIQKLSTDGSKTEFHISNLNIATVFDNTFVTKSQEGFNWLTFENSFISSILTIHKCESQWGSQFSLSPDRKLAFVTASCSDSSYLFVVNEKGNIAQQVGNPSYDGSQITQASWSPDGKYVAKVIQQLTGYTWKEDIYLFDIQRLLEDPSTQPIRLTTDGVNKPWGPIWQPIP